MLRSRKVLLYLGIIAISWIIILSVPQLHGMFLAQTISGNKRVTPSALPAQKPDFISLAKEKPNNMAIQMQAISQKIQQIYKYNSYKRAVDAGNPNNIPEPPKPISDEKTIKKELVQLARNFPNSPVPVFMTLMYSMKDMSPIREAGPLTDTKLKEHKKEGIPSPERKGERDYTPQQWQHVIDLCKEGQKRAPQNGIFDVLEAYWQFAEFHDAAGWAAMQRAAQKPEINNYSLKIGQMNVAAHRDLYGRKLTWEELAIYSPHVISSSSPAFSFHTGELASKMRPFFRWLKWEGMKQEKQGHHAKALRMYSILFQVANGAKRSARNTLDSLIATALEDMAISGPKDAGVKAEINLDKSDPYYYAKRDAATFKKYAREHHQPKMAQYAQLLLQHRKDDDQISGVMDTIEKPFIPRAASCYVLWRLDVLLLWLLAGAVIIGIIATALTRITRSKAKFGEYDFWRGAVSFAALPASLILIVGYALLLFDKLQNIHFFEEIINLRLFVGLESSFTWLAVFGVVTPVVFGMAYCWKRAARNNQQTSRPKVLLWQVLGIIGSLLFVICWASLAAHRLPFPAGNIILSGLFYGSIFVVAAGILINVALFAIKENNLKSTFADFTYLLAHSSLRFVALGSVIYLLSLAIAIPIRAPLHKREVTSIRKGELAIYKDALAKRDGG